MKMLPESGEYQPEDLFVKVAMVKEYGHVHSIVQDEAITYRPSLAFAVTFHF